MIFDIPYKTQNKVFGATLIELGLEDERITVFDADLSRATETYEFKKTFPGRYFDIGIAEANMVSMAAGYALCGKVSICGTFATFITRRVCDQVAISCALNNANVKLIGVEPGLSSGRNGATHQAVDDLAIMRACPNMSVVAPADATEIGQILKESLKETRPVYLRMLRGVSPVIFDPEQSSSPWGKAKHVLEGKDVTIVSTGIMLANAIQACRQLKEAGFEVDLLHMPYIKPFDGEALIESVSKTNCVVTVENHTIIGGLGSAVAETLSQAKPVPVRIIGIHDTFGECGERDALFERYGLSARHIVEAAKDVLTAGNN